MNSKSDCDTRKKYCPWIITWIFFSLTGGSRNWFSFYCLYRSNDSLPCFALLVSHVLPYVGKFGTWKYVRNHWRHHHTHCWYLQNQEGNSYWWVAQTLFSHWSSKLNGFFWEYGVLVFYMKIFSADILQSNKSLYSRLCFHAQAHYYPQIKPFPECYKSRKVLVL